MSEAPVSTFLEGGRDDPAAPEGAPLRRSASEGFRAGAVPDTEVRHLRVVIANEKRERLELLARVVTRLGHDVVAREIYVKTVGPATAIEHPDVALVGLASSSQHALALVSVIVGGAKRLRRPRGRVGSFCV